jgi:hypothetical protein
VLYVLFPEGYEGKIYYTIEGKLEGQQLDMQPPRGKKRPIRNAQGSIDIAAYVRVRTDNASTGPSSSPNKQPPVDDDDPAEDILPIFKDLRGFTFSLSEPQGVVYHQSANAAPETLKKIDVSYVAYVAPAIQMRR